MTVGRRAWDADSAASDLVSLGHVDRRRLVLEGDSHGRWTAPVALERGRWRMPKRFGAAIAWYPHCPDSGGVLPPPLLLIGAADDSTPAERCTALVARR